MRAGNQKQKGNAFELQICKKLSYWISDGERKDIFTRSPLSGGQFTEANKKVYGRYQHVSGDICSAHKDGYKFIEVFCVECKFQKDLQIGLLPFEQSVPKICSHWNQAKIQATKVGRFPMLVAKQNFKPELIGLNISTWTLLAESPPICKKSVVNFPSIITVDVHDLVLFEFDQFLKYFKPNIVKYLK